MRPGRDYRAAWAAPIRSVVGRLSSTASSAASSASRHGSFSLGRVTEGPSAVASAGECGYFAGVLGFDRASLEAALRRHLADNLDRGVHKASRFADEQERIEIVVPVTGPSGERRGLRAAWVVERDGTIWFMTAHADRRSGPRAWAIGRSWCELPGSHG